MVGGALLAGVLGGFIIPDRPEPRRATTATVSSSPIAKTSANGATSAPQKEQQGSGEKIRTVPLERSTAAEPEDRDDTTNGTSAGNTSERKNASSCVQETWPYRSPNCLDRTATIEPATTIVNAKRVDPAVGLAATSSASNPATNKETSNPAASKAKDSASASSSQKIVSAPKRQEPDESQAKSEPETPPVRSEPEQRKQAAASRSEDNGGKRRRPRAATRLEAESREIPAGVYFRGPDGRLYLAPEYRLNVQPRYYAR
jgi:hypothetical protein